MAFESNLRIKNRCIVGDGAHTSIARSASGVKYLTSKNFKSTGLDLSKLDHISERDFEKHFKDKRSLVKPEAGDIVFGIIGSIGTPYIVRPDDNFGISSSVAILRPSENLNCRFLYYFMTSPPFQLAVEAMKSGSAQGFLSLEMIKNLPLLDVPLKIQRKIAAILTAYDDLIENNKRRIALLENMAEEIYREWFVRFRFPGWQEAEFEKGQPAGWTHQRIAQAFDFTGGGTPSKDNDGFWRNGDVDWYTPSDITKSNSLFMTSSEYQCNEEGLRRSSAKLFPAYSVMMTSRATIGAIGINTKPACTNQGFITCIPNYRYPLTYLYHWLNAAKPHFEMLSGGATFPELIKSTFKRIEILSPDQGVIEKFDELVSPMFKQMESLAEQNRKLEQTKNQLLPRLIFGKLSVENLDIQFPPSMQSDQPDSADEAAA
jgi:type I restriction enzyme, S subunit